MAFEQQILNDVWSQIAKALRVTAVELPPTDATKTNGSLLISFNSKGQAIYLDETIGSKTYRTTFTRSDMTVASTLPISQAVEI